MKRFIVRPSMDPSQEIDLTDRLVGAIAEELWARYGGNTQLNWVEAERHLENIVNEVRAEALNTKVVNLKAIEVRSARPGSRQGSNKRFARIEKQSARSKIRSHAMEAGE